MAKALILLTPIAVILSYFVDGETFLSQEGTNSRGYPSLLWPCMPYPHYKPLIQHLNHSVQHVWYSDDATAGDEL